MTVSIDAEHIAYELGRRAAFVADVQQYDTPRDLANPKVQARAADAGRDYAQPGEDDIYLGDTFSFQLWYAMRDATGVGS